MKLALHRSFIFWSGIVVMAFIAWAWHYSRIRLAAASWGSWVVSQGHSTVSIAYRPFGKNREFITDTARAVIDKPDALPLPLWAPGQGMKSQDPILRKGTSYREQVAQLMQRADRSTWRILIPHWLCLLTVALPWTALLLWRARRRKRGRIHAQPGHEKGSPSLAP